jgi:putative hydrolase of the HAD superfamily
VKQVRRYRCIAFDAVGTLIEPVPPASHVYYQAAQRFGSRLAPDDIARRFKQAFHQSEQGDGTAAGGHVTSEDRERKRWREIVSRVIDDIPSPAACFLELFEHFARPGSWSVFPDVAATLARLEASGYRLAIASNFDRRLHAVCDGLAPLDRLGLRIISSEVGHRKPSAGFFKALADQAACSPEEILMIGDDQTNDVDGARKAGLHAVRLNRRTPPVPGEIGTLSEILSLLAE